ncbi:MAG: excinuclease ABC subunit UvrA [Candidatus Eisenbacteria bacterium]|uniref:UvrABC system protein A n=1 Tax=Eiseniibacteriota bacterium TaxID=2212470 RepID=A0A849SQ07_UNCEI|nr:excinuclease ABC subunit UvrA [Candidatus Eisenbacteria bacterium]
MATRTEEPSTRRHGPGHDLTRRSVTPLTDIVIRGAREHNLQNLSLRLPRQSLIVVTGVSGSGKSSLAFDTLYAEGQRRYVESLSAYARQFLGQMEKPDVDAIEGLSPAIAIEQRSAGSNPRSTVATITEIYDYLRLLFARLGVQHCPSCGTRTRRQTTSEIVDQILAECGGRKVAVLAPFVRGRKGEYRKELEQIRKQGYLRARTDGAWVELDGIEKLAKTKRHDIDVVVDRLTLEASSRSRLADSVEAALALGNGMLTVARDGADDLHFSQGSACPKCGTSVPIVEPKSFSFNSPYGACKACDGLGTLMRVDPDRVVPDPSLSIRGNAIAAWGDAEGTWVGGTLEALAKSFKFSLDTPWKKLATRVREMLLQGAGERQLRYEFKLKKGSSWVHHGRFEGVIPNLERRYRETTSESVRKWIGGLMNPTPCAGCGGKRLRKESLAVLIDGIDIGAWCALSVASARERAAALEWKGPASVIAAPVLKEITSRLGFLDDVGLGYLTLDRTAGTLAGGEAQRIRLATQIGSQLTGVLYILDEPSIGLHHRDNQRLLRTLLQLRDLGNTLVVVEHDEETMRAADWLLDLGPGAGRHGGRLVAAGRPEEVAATAGSLTGEYLSGVRRIEIPKQRRAGNGQMLTVRGARANNLKQIDVEFPLGRLVCVSGVSGSGKSTLVNDILLAALERHLNDAAAVPAPHRKIEGLDHLDKVVAIDQSPIGRTPRSNPATYTGAFNFIRDLFAQLPESKVRGYGPGRFSFNVKGGRCEHCQGDGVRRIEMHFLPDVYVKCEICHGRRYDRETLEVLYKGRSIADVLEMTVEEGLEFLGAVPALRRKLETLRSVGLGYIHLGQSATTLSGGEAQRVKLATELSRVATGRTLYVLDEPTTGLHFEDVRALLEVLQALVERGNSVVVIEHNLDVIKSADWLVDLGPEGGDRGGHVVAAGTPEAVARVRSSHTGQALRALLTP